MDEKRNARYHVRRREFLNDDPELPAYIIGVVEDTSEIPDEDVHRWSHGTIRLDVGDCFDRVSLHFDMSNGQERANSLAKITLLAEVVNAVREAITKESESRNTRTQILDHSEGAVA
jgi:hypothetical protein